MGALPRSGHRQRSALSSGRKAARSSRSAAPSLGFALQLARGRTVWAGPQDKTRLLIKAGQSEGGRGAVV